MLAFESVVPVDPAEALKFGIKNVQHYYVLNTKDLKIKKVERSV